MESRGPPEKIFVRCNTEILKEVLMLMVYLASSMDFDGNLFEFAIDLTNFIKNVGWGLGLWTFWEFDSTFGIRFTKLVTIKYLI